VTESLLDLQGQQGEGLHSFNTSLLLLLLLPRATSLNIPTHPFFSPPLISPELDYIS
jgi:hypothetical protein